MAKHVVDGEIFATDKALQERCSAMLHRGTGITAKEEAFLADLLTHHPDADQKIGVGLRRIFIGEGPFRKPALWLERIDGSTTDWSFRNCIKAPSHATKAKRAMRAVVADQIASFRARAFGNAGSIPCAITGKTVTAAGAHVDHRPPDTFQALAERFLALRGLSFNDVSILPGQDGDLVVRLSDPALAESWSEFHRTNARLQITSAHANMSQGDSAP